VSASATFTRVLAAIGAAFAITAVFIVLSGKNPFTAYGLLLQGAFGSWDRVMKFCDRFTGELGYAHVTPWPIYSKETGGRVMYYMIHATDHDAAPLLMARAYRQAHEQRESERALQRSFEELGMALPEQRRPPGAS